MPRTSRADTLPTPAPKAIRAVSLARKAIGVPYVWGGTNLAKGVDCSGLCWSCYRAVGVQLPRTSQEQFKVGTPVKKGNEIPGDLVFSYPNEGGVAGPGHVVMAIGNGKCISAPKTGELVKIEDLSAFDSVYVGSRRIVPAVGFGGSGVSSNSDSASGSDSGTSASAALSSLTDSHTYYRGGQFLMGVALLIAGILIITKQSPIKLAQKASKVAEIAAVA